MTLREELAASEHERWSRWMRHLFSKGASHEDGTWTMGAWAVDRWTRQMETPYSELSEDERDSDRREADRTIDIAIKHVVRVIDRWLRSYPTSVFAQPEPGQHGETVDACSAAALRAILPLVAEDIHALAVAKDRSVSGEER